MVGTASPSPCPGSLRPGGTDLRVQQDGYRVLTRRSSVSSLLLFRQGKDMTNRPPSSWKRWLPLHPVIFDGELAMQDKMGRAHWDRLRERHSLPYELMIKAASV